jgi:uncharacterized protein (UPF0332 family)/predicted nucleotidyltransferase
MPKKTERGKTGQEEKVKNILEDESVPAPEERAPEDSTAAGKSAQSKGKVEKVSTKEERVQILKKFTKDMLAKYGPLVRSVVLFGSTARDTWRGESDIDVFVIIDDTRTKISPGMREKMEGEMEAMAKKASPLLSLQQPYMLTEFWNMVRIGHPIVFNFIREGVPVYDKDIFLPIKRLLQMGEIKPSKEAVEKYIERGPGRIKRVESAKMYMIVEDLYYAMLESAQAVLMFMGKSPPRPSEAPAALRKDLVETRFMKDVYVRYLEDIIKIRKDVEHKKINKISGQKLDEWITKSNKFVRVMQNLIVKIEVIKRENMIEKSYVIMKETIVTLLKATNHAPRESENIQEVFDKYLVKPGIVSGKYLHVFSELEKMRNASKENKVLDMPKQDILIQREYVRKFIRDAGRVLRTRMNVNLGD